MHRVLFSGFAMRNIHVGVRNQSFSISRLKKPWSMDMMQNDNFFISLSKYLLLPLFIIWRYFLVSETKDALRGRLYLVYSYSRKVIKRRRGCSPSSAARSVQGGLPVNKATTFRDSYSDRLSRLLILDISTLVASNLHYTDIQSLSLASSQILEALFPTGNLRHYSAHFRRNTCNPTGKTRCWHCEVQICDVR